MQQTQTACRIPAPKPEELAALPPMAQSILNKFEPVLDRGEFKDMARLFVDVSTTPAKLGKSSELLYQNPSLRQMAIALAGIGEYNPDKIPYHVYEKMARDPVIAIGTSFIEQQILAQNYSFDCVDEQIRALVSEVFRPIYLPTMRAMLRGSTRYGFACGGKEYDNKRLRVERETEGGKRQVLYDDWATVITRIKFVHPSSISITRDPDTEDIAYVNQEPTYTSVERNVPISISVPIDQILWFAPEEEYGNVFGVSRYAAAYRPWYWYEIVIQFMLKYLERRGAPSTIGRAPFGQSVRSSSNEKIDNLDYMLQCLEALLANANVVIPSDFDKNTGEQRWDIKQLADEQRTAETFVEVLEFLNVLKMRAMFLPDKMGLNVGSSTNATAENAFDIHLLSEEALIKFCEEKLNEVADEIVRFNFPPRRQVPCRIKIERMNFTKRTLLRDIFIRMLMFASSNLREGERPNWIPSLRKLSELLEIPGDAYENIFLPMITPDGNGDQNDSGQNPMEPTDTPDEIEDKIGDRNRDAVPRKNRDRQDRRARERA